MRRSAFLILNCALVVAWTTSTLSAALVLYEPFDYTAGQRVLGQSNASTATNWLLAAAATANGDTAAINVASGSLTTPSGLHPADGNSATINGIGNLNGASNRLAFSSTSTAVMSGTVYYSLVMRVTALTGSNNTTGGFFFGLNNTGNSATTTNPSAVAARLQARVDPSDPNSYNLGVFNNRNAVPTSTFWTSAMSVGTPIFVVGSYEIVSGTGNDISRLWINPTSSTFGSNSMIPSPTLTDTAAGTDINIASILLRQSPAPWLTLDEIRVGTDWASVTAIPEPSPFYVLLLVSVLIAVRAKPWKMLGKCA